jgi:hypothetical protein
MAMKFANPSDGSARDYLASLSPPQFAANPIPAASGNTRGFAAQTASPGFRADGAGPALMGFSEGSNHSA